jgi:glutamyl-tRNA synthetase
MRDNEVAELMFSVEVKPPLHWETHYPQRNLLSNAWVTRFAPSPTGYLHMGGLYAATIAQDLAHNSAGTFFVRIENTDTARELADARAQFQQAFKYFSIEPDEDGNAAWGPYEQGMRGPIYEGYARELVEGGMAYPCFCTHAELEALAARQATLKVTPGYYGQWATCRNLNRADVIRRLRAGETYAVRFRVPDDQPERITYNDMIRGSIELLENRNDAVILKNSATLPRLPTYHFAHVVDDHLMRVNLVTRGEEWMASVPLHLQLFRALRFEPPAYAHIAPLLKVEGKSKRKLSKRKDPEASLEFYMNAGYPSEAVRIYLRGLANSNLADIDFAQAAQTPIRLDKMGLSGAVFDLVKVESISRTYIALLPPAARVAAIEHWAKQFDPTLAQVLEREHAMAVRAFEYERKLDEHPRKDLAKWADFLPNYGVFLTSYFQPVSDPSVPELSPTKPETVVAVLNDFIQKYSHESEKDTWFTQVREVAKRHRFAPTAKEYKSAPQQFVGQLSEAANIVRVGLTGRRDSPDLFLIAQVIGESEVLRRLRALAGSA